MVVLNFKLVFLKIVDNMDAWVSCSETYSIVFRTVLGQYYIYDVRHHSIMT